MRFHTSLVRLPSKWMNGIFLGLAFVGLIGSMPHALSFPSFERSSAKYLMSALIESNALDLWNTPLGARTRYTAPAPGYVAWFKADAIVGLGDGDPVGSWDDSGPNNKDAVQSSASLRPGYVVAAINGKPAIRFDGIDDRLVSPSGSGIWGLSNHFTVFAVVKVDTAVGANSHDVVGSNSLSNNLDLMARRDEGAGSWLAYSSTPDGTRNSTLSLSTGSWYILTWRLNANSPKHLQIRADKVYRLNDTGYTGIGTAPSSAAIGARNNGAHPFKGDIAEVIFYTGSLNDSDMIATENYLWDKYGFISAPPPAAPTALTGASESHEAVDLSWTDNANNEGGYRVERREGQAGTFVAIATVDVNVTEHTDQSVSGGSEYCYRVVGYNSGGDSDPSNVECVTPPLPPPDPYGEPAPGYVARFRGDAILGLADGDPVGIWEDSSPNNKDAAQSTPDLRPVFKAAIIAGKPAVRFDGVNDRLTAPGGANIWGLSNHFTVFTVVRLDENPGPGTHDVIGSSSLFNQLDLIARQGDTSGNWLAFNNTPDGSFNSDLILDTGAWHVLIWRLNANSPKHLQIRADRTYRLNDTGYVGIGTAPSSAAIGARNDGTRPFKGDIAEIIIYSNSISDADLKVTEGYLLLKYGFINLSDIPPVAPSGLVGTTIDYQTIDLDWTDNSANEAGYRVERREGQTGSFSTIATTAENSVNHRDHPVAPESEFCYRVVGYNGAGESAPSESACATTFTTPPEAPSDLAVNPVETDRIDLSWADNSTTEAGFRIERRKGQSGSFVVVGSVVAGVTNYEDRSVDSDTEYCYRVAAFSGPSSGFSNTECTSTPAVASAQCTSDPKDNRSSLVEILTNPEPFFVEWRAVVGLAYADPDQLVLISNDAVCEALWSKASRTDPQPGGLIAFFELGNRYIVTDYVNTDSSFGPIAVGYGFTTVLDDEFNVILTLAH